MPTATACRATTIARSSISSKFADTHADDNPAMPQARFVANAFVALGQYYLDGIPNTSVTREPERARRMFAYAASYFGDSEAQYQLARSISTATASSATPSGRCAGWCSPPTRATTRRRRCSAACCSRASTASRQRASGLMWLTLACDGPGAQGAVDRGAARDRGASRRRDDERALALILLERWVEGRRE